MKNSFVKSSLEERTLSTRAYVAEGFENEISNAEKYSAKKIIYARATRAAKFYIRTST